MMKVFTVPIQQSYHQRVIVTVRANDLQAARRKALRRAPQPFEPETPAEELCAGLAAPRIAARQENGAHDA